MATNSTATGGRNRTIRLTIVILILAVSLVPFFLTIHLETLDNSLSNLISPPSKSHSKTAAGTTNGKQIIQPVSCQKYLNDPTIQNPNKDLTKEETRRLTITNPPFYISLHSQWFDKMRWVHIMKNGEYYETGLTNLFHRILSTYDTTDEVKPLMLDVGMNIGWFSLYAHALGHDIAAFEPNPTMFLRVCESLEHNKWEDDGGITLWNYGLGTTPGTFNITLGNNPGGSSFYEERLAKKFRKSLAVEVTTLDTVAMQQGWLKRKISLVKVDVEGFENFVFEGGKTLLYGGNIDNIVMENSINNVTIVGGMVDMLYDAGFRVMEILTVNGDPYHEDWWPAFNPVLEERHNAKKDIETDELKFLAKVTCNIWWQHKRIIDHK